MNSLSVSRWESVPEEAHKKVKLHFLFWILLIFALIATIFYFSDLRDGLLNSDKHDITSMFAKEPRIVLPETGNTNDPGLAQTLTKLASRVSTLEGENQRLTAEMNEMLDQDGVINRLVEHVRALHAQNEATRRDVVGALMAPVMAADPAVDMEGIDPSLSDRMEGEASPLLSKARHTIVTPVEAASGATEVAPAPKGARGNAHDVEPDAGNTN